MPKTTVPRILILGGGFAGAYCAYYLEKKFRRNEAEFYLINDGNYFVFSPLLVEAGTGSLEPRHAVVPIRSFLKRTHFRMARVVKIDVAERRVSWRFRDGRQDSQGYDHLVLALGSVTKELPVPGLAEHGFKMENLGDAVRLRDRAITMLELADSAPDPGERKALLHFVVVGGNYTGVEVAGEFDAFFREASRFYPGVRKGDHTVSLVEIQNRLLPALEEDLAEFARRNLSERGIQLYLNNSVSEVGEDFVALKGGQRLASRTVIRAAGIAPNPLLSECDLPADDQGYIICSEDLLVRGSDDIWAIGDCAVNVDPEGKPYPATAQHAIQEARALARNLKLLLQGRRTEPCVIKSKGALAALGCRTGVAKVFGFKVSGFLAWWLWRTVYLLRMPTLARKIRVALDWTTLLFFSRDFVQLGLTDSRSRNGTGDECSRTTDIPSQ